MCIILCFTVSLCLLVWMGVRWGRVRRYWAERDVPHYPPHPVMGSLTFLQRENPAIFMKKMYQDFQSSYVGIWLFWRPGLIINSPAIARNVLVKDADVFRNRFLSSGQSDPVGGLNLFTVNASFMRKAYQEFHGSPYVGIWLFWRPALVINSPHLARNVLMKDSDVFRNRFASSGKSDPIGALTLFTVKDPLWTSIRKRLTTVFTAAKLRASQGLTLRKSGDLVQRIKREMKDAGEISNLRVVFSDFATDIFGESAFGVLSEATRTGDSVMKKVTRDFMGFSAHRGLSWCSIFFIPELVDIFKFSLFPKDTIEYLTKLIHKIVDQRLSSDGEGQNKGDLLDALLKMKKEAEEEGEEMTDEILLAQAAIFLLGGFDTSGSALTWAALELCHQPLLQEKLYNELLEAKQRVGGRDFDSTTLAELPYLNAVFKETLRKFPPMGWLDRVAASNYQVDDKLTIPAGTAVYVNAIGMHWDPENFPEPEKFDPDRFLPENEANIKPYTYMPFGEGPRICIGMRFGYQTIRFGLSSIILNYKIVPLPTTPLTNDVQVERKGMFLFPEQRIHVQFIPRS